MAKPFTGGTDTVQTLNATTSVVTPTVATDTVNAGDVNVSDDLVVTGDTLLNGAVIRANALPTADPAVAGVLWNDAGTVKVSAG